MKLDQCSLWRSSRPAARRSVALLLVGWVVLAAPARARAEAYQVVPTAGVRSSVLPCPDDRVAQKLTELLAVGMTIVVGDASLQLQTGHNGRRSGNFFVAGGFYSAADEYILIGDWQYAPGLRVLVVVVQDTKECPNAECWYDASIKIAMVREPRGADRACYVAWLGRVPGTAGRP